MGIPNRKRRILIVSERFHPEHFLVNDLARQLVADGFRVEVLTQIPSYPQGRLYPGWRNRPVAHGDWEGVRVTRVGTVCGYRTSLFLKLLHYGNFLVFGSLAVMVRGRRFEEVFVYHAGSLTAAVPGIVAARLSGARLSLWNLDLWPETVHSYGLARQPAARRFLDRFIRSVYGRCSDIFVPSRAFTESVSRYAARERIHFLPAWLPPPPVHASVREGTEPRSDRFRFTFTGNIGKAQNLEAVIRGFHAASKEIPGFGILDIVGDGSALPSLKNLVKEGGIGGVEFTGMLPPEAMESVHRRSDVLILSLRDDPAFVATVPWKFLSYLAARKPILCVARGETARLVREHGLGLVADPGDPADVARAFLGFSRSTADERDASGARGAALLRECHNRDILIGRLESFLRGNAFEDDCNDP